MALMRLDNLSFTYKGKRILKNINMKIESSEIYSIIGPNGAGKTTLLNCLTGLAGPFSGEVFLKEKPIGEYGRRDFCKIVSYVPQMHRPVFNYTVEEIVLMGKNPCMSEFSLPTAEDRKEVLKILDELKISHLKDRYYTKISGGELRMVLIARALIQAGGLIVMDEPAAHLDIKNQFEILEIIRNLASNKKSAVVMVVHDPDHALFYSDKAMLLKEGENIASGNVFEILTSENLSMVYGVEVKVVEFEGRKITVPIKKNNI